MKITLCALLFLAASIEAMEPLTIESNTVNEQFSQIIVNGTAAELEAFLYAHPDCDINNANTIIEGYTPLQVACSFGNKATGTVLIVRGASLEASDARVSPFRLAARNGMRGICELLMEKDPSVMKLHGEAAVKAAIENGHTEIVLLCIEQEVPIDYEEALYVAAEHGHREIVDLFLQWFQLESDTKLLHAAARGGLIDLCRTLLEVGTPINETDDVGYTALLWAQDRLTRARKLHLLEEERRLQAVCDLLMARGGTDTWVDPKDVTNTWKFYCGVKLLVCGARLFVLYKQITDPCKGCRKDKKQ